MRCPKCGNDVNKNDYVCIYCSTRLIEESIEKIPFFKRIEEKWTTPETGFRRLINVIIKPSRAFWDMTHYRKKIGSGLVFFLTAVLFGLIGIAAYSHIRITSWNGVPITFRNSYLLFFNGLALFALFFLFGLLYYLLFYFISIKLYSLAANYSIGLKSKLKLRYGEGKKKHEKEEMKKQNITTTMKEAEGATYIGELPEYLTAEKSKKTSIMLYAFAPMMIALAACVLILLIGLPYNVSIQVTSSFLLTPGNVASIWASPLWGIIDWIQVIALIGWVPVTMSIALRDIANASTLKAYISCLLISILLAALIYFSRPTFLFIR